MSLSNLVKQSFVITNANDARIINSNNRLEEKLRKLESEARASSTHKQTQQEVVFEEGLAAEVIEPEVEVTREQILQEAQQEAEATLKAAQRRADAIVSEANQKAETLFEAQKAAGYRAGSQRLEEELKQQQMKMSEEHQKRLEALETQYRNQMEVMERDIVDALIPVFDQVFRIQYGDKKEILLHLISNTLMNVDAGKKFRIRVSRENCSFVEEHLPEISLQLGKDYVLEVVGDQMLKGQDCRIESDFGTFDCSLDLELENLIKDIRSLCVS